MTIAKSLNTWHDDWIDKAQFPMTDNRRYMEDDWMLVWDGLVSTIPFVRILHFPAYVPPGVMAWGCNGALRGVTDEKQRRTMIAAQAWEILDTEPRITFEMMNDALSIIGLELIRTAMRLRVGPDADDYNARANTEYASAGTLKT